MCGIIFIHQNRELGRASKRAYKLYLEQKSRGTRGYGCVIANNNKVADIYRSQNESGIEKIKENRGDMAMFHHRTPTSTPNVEECTHPIIVSNDKLQYDYYVIHNGVISNAQELKTKFEDMGYLYTTVIETVKMYKIGKKQYRESQIMEFNDTESLAIDLALAIEGNKTKLDSKGSIAFIAMQVDKQTQDVVCVYFGRNYQSPLKMTWNDQELVLSSLGTDGDVEVHKLHCYYPKAKRMDECDLSIDKIEYTPKVEPVRNLFGYKPEKGYMGFVDTNKKVNRDIGTASVRIYKTDGSSELITYQTQGDYIYRTTIEMWDADLLFDCDWTWYKNTLSSIDSALSEIKMVSKEKHMDLVKQRFIKILQDRNRDLKILSEYVNDRKKNNAIVGEKVADGKEVTIKH